MKRVTASRMMETQRAIRNTALKKAPRISARSHPYEYLSVVAFPAILNAHSPTNSDMMSLSMWKASAVNARE